jgi:4-amino-4-deoxy-L-arabinose transferase-like glycosyltransferase
VLQTGRPDSVITASDDVVASPPTRAERHSVPAILALSTLGAVVILAGLAQHSLRQDEAFTVVLVREPARVFWRLISEREANTSGFYLLARLWSHLGWTEGWERLPSALAAVAALPALWLVGRRVANAKAALLAPALLLGNGMFLGLARFGRGYAPEVLLTTLASLALVVAVQDHRRLARWLWASLIVAATYMHVFGLLVLAAHLVALAIAPAPERRRDWTGPVVLAGVLLSPLLFFFATRSGDQIFWVDRTTVHAVIDLPVKLLGNGGHIQTLVTGLAITVVLWRLLAEGLARRWSWESWFVICWAAVPVILGVALSIAKPVLVPNYFVIAAPPLMLLTATGATRLPRRVGGLLIVALLMLTVRSAVTAHPGEVEDWRSATAYLIANASAQDAFAVEVSDERAGVEYYATRAGLPSSLPRPCFPNDPWGQLEPRSGRRPASAVNAVRRCAARHPILWIEHRRHEPQPNMRLTGWRHQSTAHFGRILVERFTPAPPS